MNEEENFLKAVKELRKNKKKRNFDQTIDLIVNLQNFNIKKDSFNIFIQVPHKIKEKKIAGFLEKKSDLVYTIRKEDFQKFKEKKDIKKLVKNYDFFIANAKLMPQVAMNFGRILGPAGKMPNPKLGVLSVENENTIKAIIEKINSSIRIIVKEPSIKAGVGKESLTDEQILENILIVYRSILDSLPKKKENVKSVFIKLTMDKPIKVEI